MIIKRTIKLAIQSQQNASSRVRMRVSYNGYRVDFQTGILLNKDSWDNLRQRVLPNDSNVTLANDLNDHLSKMLSNMIEVFREFELHKVIPTPTELRKAFNLHQVPQPNHDDTTQKSSTLPVPFYD